MKTLFYFFLLLSIALFADQQLGYGQRPNIVFIIMDDMSEKTIPPLGPSFLSYPSISRIYQEGMYVCDAYTPMPLCNPCRYSILTGMYPHTHLAVDNSTAPRKDLPTFFSILAGAGYHNAYVGKYANINGLKNLPGIPKTLTIGKIDQEDPTMYFNNKQVFLKGVTAVIIDDTATAWLAKLDTPFALGIGNIGTHIPMGVVKACQNTYNNKGALPDNFYRYRDDYPSFYYTDSEKFCTEADSSGGKN